jgi:hypothetical protein
MTTDRDDVIIATPSTPTSMPPLTKRSFAEPGMLRTPPLTRVEVVDLGPVRAARFTMQPGWRWSDCVRPVAGTERCEVRHVGAVISGYLHLVHIDGADLIVGPGDAYVIEPGHEAWVEGDEPFVAYEFDSSTAETFATEIS